MKQRPIVFSLLLWLYPPSFRRRFGSEMVSTLTSAHHAARGQGGLAVVRFWARTAGEVLVCATAEWGGTIRRVFRERRRPRRPRPSQPPERVMTFLHDFHYAIRSLARRPGLVAAAVATLALGVGANTAVFSVANGILWRPLDYDHPDELVAVWPGKAFSTSEATFIREHSRTLADVATVAGWTVAITEVRSPTQVYGARTSANVFRLLGVRPALGRDFTADDVAVGAAPVVMLSHGMWRGTFGSDTSIVGRTMTIDGDPHEVVGVMPPSFEILNPTQQLWIPLIADPNDWTWQAGISQAIGRVQPGITLTAAHTEFLEVLAAYRDEHGRPDTYGEGASVVGLKEVLVGNTRTTLLILLGAVGFILLIAGANLSGLLLARAVDRQREMALRAALGATRARLVQTVLTESAVLSVLGAAAGLGFAFAGVSFITGLVPANTPRIALVSVDLTVLAACLGFAAFAGIVFSLVPALVTASRGQARDVTGARSDAAAISTHRWQHGFLVAQIALAVTLIVGAGLMVRTTRGLTTTDPGFVHEQILSFHLQPAGAGYSAPEQYRGFYRDLMARLESLPFVQSVGGVQHLPLSGWSWGTQVEIVGRPIPPGQAKPRVGWRIVTGDYFETLRIPVLQGRALAPTDRANTPAVGVVNRAFAQRFFPGESPLGRQVLEGRNGDNEFTVVGVVDDVRHTALDRDPVAEIYMPLEQSTMPSLMMAVRTDGPPARHAARIQDEVWAIDPNIPISALQPYSEVVTQSLGRYRLVMVMLTLLALVALGLGAIGVYGVTAFAVTRRTGEFGIRMALGASHGCVQREVLGLGLRRAVLGTSLGLVAAFALNDSLSGLVYGVSTTDPVTYLGVGVFMLGVAVVASWLPAWRATRIDPATALRK